MTFTTGPFLNAPQFTAGQTFDMSLKKNTPGQNVTFALINPTSDLPATGATVTIYVSLDGGAQFTATGTITELGHGAYNYAPTAAETNGNTVSYLVTAPTAIPSNLMFFTQGFKKNVGSQHVTCVMFATSGSVDTGATITVYVTKDGTQSTGGGSITNLGNGQYDYAPTSSET